jgi:hypothetical protein
LFEARLANFIPTKINNVNPIKLLNNLAVVTLCNNIVIIRNEKIKIFRMFNTDFGSKLTSKLINMNMKIEKIGPVILTNNRFKLFFLAFSCGEAMDII